MHQVANMNQPYYLINILSNLMKNSFKKANCLHSFVCKNLNALSEGADLLAVLSFITGSVLALAMFMTRYNKTSL